MSSYDELQDLCKEQFNHLSTAQLKARMERASSSTNLDDETCEFARRMDEAGNSWYWDTDDHIVIEGKDD